MTRQSKLIILLAYLVILTVVMLVYRNGRVKRISKMRTEVARVAAEKEKIRAGEAELARLSRLFPAEADSTGVVEALYRSAKASGLQQHEVTTDPDKQQGNARAGVSKQSAAVATYRIKVVLAGSFRQIAEYIRQVQNMERFTRITEFKLAPDANRVKGSLSLEIFSLAAKP